MKRYTTYKYRAYPNKTMQSKIDNTIEMCHIVYNTILKNKYNIYNAFCSYTDDCDKKHIDVDMKAYFKAHKSITVASLRASDEKMKEADSLALKNEEANVTRAFMNFFGGKYRAPKKKTRKDKLSYVTDNVNNNIRQEGKRVRIPKVGFVRCRGVREINKGYIIKRATVIKEKTGKYYICLLLQYEDSAFESKSECISNEYVNRDEEIRKKQTELLRNKTNIDYTNAVGLDFKVGDIFVSSDNTKPEYGHLYRKMLEKLRVLEKKLAKKKKYSNNYWKMVNKIRALHKRLVNRRNNILQKESTKLAKIYHNVIVEKLDIVEMVHELKSAINIYDTSYHKFVKMLKYKLKGYVVYIDRWFPSSKTCSKCYNKKKKLKLGTRIYVCSKCGNIMDRDLNASINILREGKRMINEVINYT